MGTEGEGQGELRQHGQGVGGDRMEQVNVAQCEEWSDTSVQAG